MHTIECLLAFYGMHDSRFVCIFTVNPQAILFIALLFMHNAAACCMGICESCSQIIEYIEKDLSIKYYCQSSMRIISLSSTVCQLIYTSPSITCM